MAAPLMVIGTLFSMAGSMSQGISALNASTQLAGDLQTEGSIIFREAMRTAAIIEEEGYKFAAEQSLQYISSGVHIAGSALITIAQTKAYAKEEAEAVRSRGRAERSLANRKATTVRNEGRAALISGMTEAGGTLFSAAAAGQKGKKPPPPPSSPKPGGVE